MAAQSQVAEEKDAKTLIDELRESAQYADELMKSSPGVAESLAAFAEFDERSRREARMEERKRVLRESAGVYKRRRFTVLSDRFDLGEGEFAFAFVDNSREDAPLCISESALTPVLSSVTATMQGYSARDENWNPIAEGLESVDEALDLASERAKMGLRRERALREERLEKDKRLEQPRARLRTAAMMRSYPAIESA